MQTCNLHKSEKRLTDLHEQTLVNVHRLDITAAYIVLAGFSSQKVTQEARNVRMIYVFVIPRSGLRPSLWGAVKMSIAHMHINSEQCSTAMPE